MNYLYGASIQGIQTFIFETNKLKEIIGASEIVEQLSKDEFQKTFDIKQDAFIMHAAGNIKLISNNKDKIKKIVREWPKKVEDLAPGLTLSQAVICFNGELTKKNIDELERKLQIVKNKTVLSSNLSPMAAVRSRRTGKPAIDWNDHSTKKSTPRDLSSAIKQTIGHDNAPQTLMDKCFSKPGVEMKKYYPFNIADVLPSGEETGWLAVIHADGNNLGKTIQKLSEDLQNSNKNLKDAFTKFSRAINRSTITATKKAVKKAVISKNSTEKYPFRPVILGGDDLTLIIRADLALEFIETFLKEFEAQTRDHLKELIPDGLTACAGISYVKSSYPFHYAVALAEELCADAKKISKKIALEDKTSHIPSSVSFHKIQDSFVDGYEDIVNRELSPQSKISFKFGPYGINDDRLPLIRELKTQVEIILKKDAPKSGIRKWLSFLHESPAQAKLWLERVKDISGDKYIKKLRLEDAIKDNRTHLYDVLSLASLSKQEQTIQGD